MKIAIVFESVFPEYKGGIERWYMKLSRGLIEKGHSVVYLNASGINEFRDGIEYICLTKKPWAYKKGGIRSKRQAISYSFSVFNWLNKNKIDAVYCSSVPLLSIFGVFLSGIFKKRKDIYEWFEIWPLRYWIRYSGHFIGPISWVIQIIAIQATGIKTVFTKKAYEDIGSMTFYFRKKNIKLMDGLCESRFATNINASVKRNDILYLGRFVDEKQPLLALEAVKKFSESSWNGKFWLIGDGPIFEEINKKIKYLNMQEKVTILRNASDSTVIEKFQSSFALLHLSRREGYGLAVVEAAYNDVPSILIHYPDNAAIDLQINPELICKSDSIGTISEKLMYAFLNQKIIEIQTKTWVEMAIKSKSYQKTIDSIDKLLNFN